MQFEKTGVQREKIQGIYGEDRSIGASYLLSLKSYEENYVDQADALGRGPQSVRRIHGGDARHHRTAS